MGPLSAGRCLAVLGTLLALCAVSDAALAAMSIDLGSQFLKIGLVKPGVPMEIVLNTESRRKTPNLLSIRNGERLFAEAAAALSLKFPKSGYQYLLNLIGKKDGDPSIDLYRSRFPFAAVSVDEERGTVVFPVESEQMNVETLVAMILWSARQTTEAFAQQPVKDVVITVPVFLTQAERRAVAAAADIAGLNLLQLLSDGSAAALNYGVFRRREITEQAQTMMIYDMGAQKTVATIVEYVLEGKDKSKEPAVRTIGVGFDRTLGGLEITLRMQKHLEQLFRSSTKTPTDIATNPRSMAKLFKEAERVKQVLSANKDHFAQIENAHEESNFRAKVTRDELEAMIVDLEPRVTQPIKDALKMAEMNMEQIDQFVLMGAGTRVPKVQQLIKEMLGEKEIGRFLNTDEAIALGAVYQAADLSKSFKVLPFKVYELQMYPIQVDFESKSSEGETKQVSRTIFGLKTHYPAPNKIVSFTTHTDDFSFDVNYGDLSHLSAQQLKEFGATHIASVQVKGVAPAIEKEAASGGAFKGVKAHLSVDLSGIVTVAKAEVVAEHPPKVEEEKPEEEEKKDEDNDKKDEKKDKKKKDKKDKKKKEKKEKDDKPTTVKVALTVEEQLLDLAPLSDDKVTAAKKRLSEFESAEKAKAERETAMNHLESSIYDIAAKMEEEDFAAFVKEEEKEKILAEVARLRLWMEDDVGVATTTTEFKDNQKALDETVKNARWRIKQHKAMPKAVEKFDNATETANAFLVTAKNLTTLEEPVFTETELEVLTKIISETAAWWQEKQALLVEQKKSDDPAITVGELKDKTRDLEREVRYLLNKMKNFKPKKKAEEKKEKAEEKDGEKKEQEQEEEKAEEKSTDAPEPEHPEL